MSVRGGRLAFDLSGLSIVLAGLDPELATGLGREWRAFAATEPREAWLEVHVGDSGHRIVARPGMRGIARSAIDGASAVFTSDEGEIELGAQGVASARLGSGDPAWRLWGLANLLIAAIAYRLPSLPGALLHAAGVEIDGRAFLLVGSGGSGKSTWARAARDAGARVVGDDSVLVDASREGLALLGSPVRAHEARPGGPGRWPVAAILHARFGPSPRLARVDPLVVEARLVANLPFLAAAWGSDPRLGPLVDLLATRVPHRELTFAPDPSFVPLLRDDT